MCSWEILIAKPLFCSMHQDTTGYVCLLIQPAKKADAGWYTLSAKNEAGIVSCTARLDIYGGYCLGKETRPQILLSLGLAGIRNQSQQGHGLIRPQKRYHDTGKWPNQLCCTGLKEGKNKKPKQEFCTVFSTPIFHLPESLDIYKYIFSSWTLTLLPLVCLCCSPDLTEH